MNKDLENMKKMIRAMKKIRARKKKRGESTGKGLSLKVSSGTKRGQNSTPSSGAKRGGSRTAAAAERPDRKRNISGVRSSIRRAKVLYDHRHGFRKAGAAVLDLIQYMRG